MAKYTINHTCGHQVTVQLFGAYKDRERRIAYLETCPCDECRRAKANADAAAAKEQRGLADLTGSEKQIAWANTIREAAYKCLDMLMTFAAEANNTEAVKMVNTWKGLMDSENEAKWWIDHRNSLPSDHNPAAARKAVSMFNEIFK